MAMQPEVLVSIYWGVGSPLCVSAAPNAVYCVGDTAEAARVTLRTASALCRMTQLDPEGAIDCSLARFAVPIQSDGTLPTAPRPPSQRAVDSAVVPIAAGPATIPAISSLYSLVNPGLTDDRPTVVTIQAASNTGCPPGTQAVAPLFGAGAQMCALRG
jgi:hypothetical protein